MRLVVAGGVAAGLSAAARARRLDRSLEIVVLEKGESIAYGACGLPYYLEGQVRSLDDLVVYTPEYFKKERDIEVRTGAAVAAIEHASRQVRLANGERLRYDRLVIATGARANRSIAGAGRPGVFALHTMEDARQLGEHLRLRQPRRAVVIGASYLGLEAAEALAARGLEVTVFGASANLLARKDPELTAAVREALERSGVRLELASPVRAIDDAQVNGVPCDLVLLACGIRPNAELAAEAGVRLGRSGAIAADPHMETNLSGVYAAGDCAEVTHRVLKRPVYAPLGTTANKMGRVAGANAAGRREAFPGIAGTSVVRVFDLGVAMTGLSLAQAREAGFDAVSARIEHREKPRYFDGRRITVELVAERGSGRLLGASVLGGPGDVAGRINVVAASLSHDAAVDGFEHLDLAYAPPFASVWDPLLIAAQQLRRLL